MFSSTDTIVALATPGGRSGLGVVRLSGSTAKSIACELIGRTSLNPREATLARLTLDGALVDHVIVTFFAHPNSYTTEDLVEISAHGSPVVLQQIVAAAINRGARLARPGEFTFRAFVNGRIDLTQAEAVADLIDAVTPRQARAASAQLDGALAAGLRSLDAALFDLVARLEASLDFPDEGYHFVESATLGNELARQKQQVDDLLYGSGDGQLIRDGVRVVIQGRPNVGKSSLFNYLTRSDRAIVTEVAGTTRDLLVESIDLNGIPVTLVDTAGVREPRDGIEQEGIRRANAAGESADVVLVVLDRSVPLEAHDQRLLQQTDRRRRVIAANKCDVPAAWQASTALPGHGVVCEVSSLSGDGCNTLLISLAEAIGCSSEFRDTPRVTNERHIHLLHKCSASLGRALEESRRLGSRAPEELLLFELGEARAALEEIVGPRTADDVLALIFDRFCIGK